jgi:hypothetical protein
MTLEHGGGGGRGQVLKTFDSDGDGVVSAKEFRCAAGTRRGAGWTRIGGAWSVCTGLG